ncbi:hydroxymethylglutaryl-CoA synthase family protein [Teredinibacter haidensis]|uniref:hydroxymethylglutaryl-CoA synthase family protein n=1 Tax=Teredinibacter haidensis TaxID=2731755 RepID=UPI0009489FF3|nr:hydroxymethylglutaryl-CoA synthase [Teredinibacter haidensis]
MRVGIEAIAFHCPQHYLDLVDLAEAREIDPDKFTKGLGQLRMAIATPMEDPVHLAINAGLKAIQKFNIDPAEIGTLVVGTETGVDHSKPVAVYVHQALGLKSNCHTYEAKHACFGAMAAVTSAADWISCGRAAGKKALIIAADIARYPIGDAGEPTQGAGAVAMIISDTPKLLTFDEDITGNYTKHVMDFWRPLYSKTAFVDGHYSIDCYLDALSGAYSDAMSKATLPQLFKLDQLDACIYHVPFVKMAIKAHQRHYEIDNNLIVERDTPEYATFRESLQQRVTPWLSLNAIVGNIYTGSLFLALIDLLRQNTTKTLRQISLFSYGSGCAASWGIVYPTQGFEQYTHLIDPQPELDARKRLSVSEYENIVRTNDQLGTGDTERFASSDWGLTGKYLYLGNTNHIRQYSDFE